MFSKKKNANFANKNEKEGTSQYVPKQEGSSSSKSSLSNTGKPVSFETISSASLSTTGKASVPFHALLSSQPTLDLNEINREVEQTYWTPPLSYHDSFAEKCDDYVNMVSGTAMTLPYIILVPASIDKGMVFSVCDEIFSSTQKHFNGWNKNSEISKINGSKVGKKMKISPEVEELFKSVDEVYDLTSGKFDPTTAAISRAFYNSLSSNGVPPSQKDLNNLRFAIGWPKVIARKKGTVTRNNSHSYVDLDGISKGFVVDKISSKLFEKGVRNMYIDWAGDIRYTGQHPGGRPWSVAIATPPSLPKVFSAWKSGTYGSLLAENDIGFLVKCNHDVAIACSGDYFSIQKFGFHHIARPKEKVLAKATTFGIASVVVAAKSCYLADAVATSAMTFVSVDEARDYLEKICKENQQIFGYCVMSRSDVKYTKGLFQKLDKIEASSDDAAATTQKAGHDGIFSSKIISGSVQQSVTLVNKEKSIEVNNVTSCSMEKEPIIAIKTSPRILEKVDILEMEPEGTFTCVVTDGIVGGKNRTGRKARVRLVSVNMISEDCCILIGALDSIQLGKIDGIFGPEPANLNQRALELFRGFRTSIWIITSIGADSKESHGITANSVLCSTDSNGWICFNIGHNSRLWAEWAGVGSQIRFHSGAKGMEEYVQHFIKNSRVEDGMEEAMMNSAKVLVKGTVHSLIHIEDHSIVCVKIDSVKMGDQEEILVWHTGGMRREVLKAT